MSNGDGSYKFFFLPIALSIIMIVILILFCVTLHEQKNIDFEKQAKYSSNRSKLKKQFQNSVNYLVLSFINIPLKLYAHYKDRNNKDLLILKL